MNVSVNLMLNEGDLLEDTELWRVKTTRQNLKVSSKEFRRVLLKNGIGHAFFKEFLWLCPVNGVDVDEEKVEQTVKSYFTRFDEISVSTTTLTSDEVWLDIGIVLLRDALSYALRNKLKDYRDVILAPKRKFYSSNFVTSNMYAGVIIGLSLDKIFRVNSGNVAIAPNVVYECVDSQYKVVEDNQTRLKLISRISKRSTKAHERIVEGLFSRISPLRVYVSDRELLFQRWKYTLKSRERTVEGEVKKATQTDLGRWLL
ncbi:hypothetical protein [Archaeoglobus sp.]